MSTSEHDQSAAALEAAVVTAAFRQWLESLPLPYLAADVRGRIVFTNTALDRLLGYERGELVGSLVEVLLPLGDRLAHPELRDAYVQLPRQRAMATDRELCCLSKSGRLVPVEVHLNPVEVGGQTFVGAAVVDVSRTADKLDRSRQALDAASSAMVMVDAEGVIVLVNAKVTEMFGYEREQLIGSPIELLVPEALRRRHEVYRRSYGADRTERTMETGRDLHGRRADGSEFALEIGLVPIESQGSPLVMATVIDTTDRRQAEQLIEARNAELVERNAELEQVASSASRDLKAPLTTLDGLLSCIAEDLERGDHDAIRLNIERSQMLARRLARLIGGILGPVGADQSTPQWTDLADLIEVSVASLGGSLADHDVRVSVDVHECLLFTEPLRVSQIVQDLLANAAKFADPAKPERRVSIGVEQHDDSITIIVADNGIGVPGDHEHDGFSTVARFDNHGEPGSELGLSQVKRHVDQLGGSVSYERSPEGTTCRVVLPATFGARSTDHGTAGIRSSG